MHYLVKCMISDKTCEFLIDLDEPPKYNYDIKDAIKKVIKNDPVLSQIHKRHLIHIISCRISRTRWR